MMHALVYYTGTVKTLTQPDRHRTHGLPYLIEQWLHAATPCPCFRNHKRSSAEWPCSPVPSLTGSFDHVLERYGLQRGQLKSTLPTM